MARKALPALLATSFVMLGIVTACGGTEKTGSSTSGVSRSCEELASSASAEVAAALDAHKACTAASGCASIAFAADCFDSCTRAVAAGQEDAVRAAVTRVNGAQCKQFKEQGCKLVVPPCAPPTPPTCESSACQ